MCAHRSETPCKRVVVKTSTSQQWSSERSAGLEKTEAERITVDDVSDVADCAVGSDHDDLKRTSGDDGS